jgi:hypothetical protein
MERQLVELKEKMKELYSAALLVARKVDTLDPLKVEPLVAMLVGSMVVNSENNSVVSLIDMKVQPKAG